MKCSNCGTELKTGYTAQLHFGGVLRIVKMDPALNKTAAAQASLCPVCGKLEWYLPPEKIPFIEEL